MPTRRLPPIGWLLVAVLSAAPAVGAPPRDVPPQYYAARLEFDAGLAPRRVVHGDFDADGCIDLALANDDATLGLTILRGQGDGTFEAPESYATGFAGRALAVCDLNLDGLPDIAWAGVDAFSVWLGRGDGTFVRAADLPAADAEHREVLSADFNEDGLPDLAAVYTSGLRVELGDGTGHTWSHPGSYLFPGAQGLASGDWDEDGHLDLAVGTAGAGALGLLLCRGLGTGVFACEAAPAPGPDVGSVASADFDRDGHADLALVFGATEAIVLRGHGDGTFALPLIAELASGTTHLTTGDFDGDEIPDLAVSVATFELDHLAVLLGRGDGTFAPATWLDANREPRGVHSADLDGDGTADLVVADAGAHGVSVRLGTGNGRFPAPTWLLTGLAPVAVTVADFGGDGRADLAVADERISQVALLAGQGDGTFGDPVLFAAGHALLALTSGDFDADGAPDLAAAARLSANAVVLLNDGAGGLSAPVEHAVPRLTFDVAAGDLDADGHLDLVVAGHHVGHPLYEGSVAVMRGLGGGAFGAPLEVPAGRGTHDVALGDLDGDGILDAAVANWRSSDVAVLLGNGDGTLQAAAFHSMPNATAAVAVVELNGDGVMDLAVSSAGVYPGYPGVLSVLLGRGGGAFGPRRDFPAGVDASSLLVGDVDGDGLLDALTGNGSRNRIAVLRGDGSGGFGAPLFFGVGTEPGRLVGGDFFGRGGLDLAVPGCGDGYVAILENLGVPPCDHTGDADGNGRLTAGDAQRAFAIALGAYSPSAAEACAADCNGDGLVTAADAQGIFGVVLGVGGCIDPPVPAR